MTGTTNTYLLDTGADISVIKQSKIRPGQYVDTASRSKIKGVTEGFQNTLGMIDTEIFAEKFGLEHNFHIVSNDFPIPTDGILGRDFISGYNCILDYSDWIMTIRLNNKDIYIPIQTSDDDILLIPPRCEVIRQVNNLKNLTHDVLIVNKELKNGVFVARSIVSRQNPIVRIINTTFEEVTLKNVQFETVNLDEFHIYNIISEPADRKLNLLKQLNLDVPDFVKNDVVELCEEFSDIFALKTDRISVNNFYEQKLKLRDNNPVYIKNYRTPKVQKNEINRQIEKMLDNDIIESSCSEYNSPVLLVPKKSPDGQNSWRLVIDFRAINKNKLIADKFPLPRIDDILDELGRAKWFSVIDLISGFHQIPLDEESRDVTSFSTDSGSYRFTRLPFGLSVSPNSFQRMMSMAFAGITPEKAFLYMDDLIVIGCSEKHHLSNLKKVFQTCRKYNLKLNPEKCNFFRKEVTFLGHKITDKGILPDDSKHDAINKYPLPKSADEVKRFVAFCNYYRRFIPNFASVTQPLNKLTRKSVDFLWTRECQNSFDHLKKALISPQILQYPDFTKQFIVTTDASKDACGAVLSQIFDGQELPIAYASRTFTKGESHKPVILKELTAIHWAIKFFRCYLYGQKFLVKTDHRPLAYLFSMKDPSSKLTRMRLDLEEYDFEIEYIKGADNVSADALSRISIDTLKEIHEDTSQIYAITRSATKSMERSKSKLSNENILIEPKIYETLDSCSVLSLPNLKFEIKPSFVKIMIKYKNKMNVHKTIPITNDSIALEQLMCQLNFLASEGKFNKIKLSLGDEIFKRCTVSEFKQKGLTYLKNITIVLYKVAKLVVSKEERLELLEKYHNDPLYGGHCGQKRLLKKLKCAFKWKNMSRDVANFVKKCHKCQINKGKTTHVEPLVITPTPQGAFDIVCIDTIGPFQKTNAGNVYATTIQCELTKYVIIIPIPNKEAATVARSIVENFVLIYGTPKVMRTDMGSEYKNQIFDKITELLGTEHKMSTAYHSQTIGGCERNHRVFNEYIRMYINQTHTDWDNWTRYYAFCYNTTPSSYHNYTPFELIFGKKIDLDTIAGSQVDPLYNIDAYDQEVRYRLQLAHNRAKSYLVKAKTTRKVLYDARSSEMTLKVGDLVMVTNEDRTKFDPWYDGPFPVVGIEDTNCILQNDRGKHVKVHKNRLKKYII